MASTNTASLEGGADGGCLCVNIQRIVFYFTFLGKVWEILGE